MDFIRGIQWENPIVIAGVVAASGAILAAIIAGVFGIIKALLTRRSPSDHDPGAESAAINPMVKVGLDETAVGERLSKAVDPLAHEMVSVSAHLKALTDQLATVQVAPKQMLPASDDPLKVKAVEFFNAGAGAQGEGEIGQAIGHYLDALALDPDYAHAHNNLGTALMCKGDVEGAVEHYNEALRIDPDYAYAHNNLGNALQSKGDLDGAIEHHSEALRIDLDYANAYINLGAALARKGDFDGTIKHCKQAVQIDWEQPDAHNNLGTALKGKGDIDGAIEHYNEAIRINPRSAKYHDNLAATLAEKKEAAQAVEELGKAIELDERYRACAKDDQSYDPIRDDPAFRKLVYGE